MISVGIVILNYNNFTDTINCIKSIYLHCQNENIILTIVDNGSSNDSIIRIESFFKENKYAYHSINNVHDFDDLTYKIVIIKNIENLGYAKGNNVGIRFLINQKAEYILILNNDIILTGNIINPLVNCLKTHPDLGLVSPLLMRDEITIDYNCCRKSPTIGMIICESTSFLKLPGIKRVINKKYLLKIQPNIINNTIVFCDIISGSCIMASTVTWEKINGFDSKTFLYYEENILFEKLKNVSLKSAVLITINAIHLGAKATKEVKNTKILRIDMNSLVYYLKTYRNVNIIVIVIIKLIRLLQIQFIVINNKINNKYS
jgi:GT2 family glycosyltransferase